jgi:DHA1 family bicyclomycin/chloramphenicol resistance-like MFS transporter
MLGTLGAAILGFLIGLAFDGTVLPYAIGTAACSVGGFIAIVLTEPRNLFARIRQEPDEPTVPAVPEEVV